MGSLGGLVMGSRLVRSNSRLLPQHGQTGSKSTSSVSKRTGTRRWHQQNAADKGLKLKRQRSWRRRESEF